MDWEVGGARDASMPPLLVTNSNTFAVSCPMKQTTERFSSLVLVGETEVDSLTCLVGQLTV